MNLAASSPPSSSTPISFFVEDVSHTLSLLSSRHPPTIRHCSALAQLLNSLRPLLSNLPHHHTAPPECPLLLLTDDLTSSLATLKEQFRLKCNSYQQLHILQALLQITQRIKALLLHLANHYGDAQLFKYGKPLSDESEDTEEVLLSVLGPIDFVSKAKCPKDGVAQRPFLGKMKANTCSLDQGKSYPSSTWKISSLICFRRLTQFSIEKFCIPIKSPTSDSSENDGREEGEVNKKWSDALRLADKNLDLLRLSLKNLTVKLSLTVETVKSAIISQRSSPSFVTRALLRDVLYSFLHANFDSEDVLSNEILLEGGVGGFCEDSGHAHRSASYGEKLLVGKSEEVIVKLRDPRGPSVVAICGKKGVGKTSLASFVCCDHRILGDFPGGIHWVSVGYDPDLISLQRLLWRKISGSKVSFTSLEEGTDALKRRFSEGLPSLLVLDDVWELSHLEPFIYFEGKDQGRILLTSRKREALPEGNIHVCVVGALQEEQALSLFSSIAGWKAPFNLEMSTVVSQLVQKCKRLPWVIQAVASILHKDENALRSPCVKHLMQVETSFTEDKCCDLEKDNFQESNMSGNGQQLSSPESECSFPWALLPCFEDLGGIHPFLQECLLDLAAFPKGKWVDLRTLEDLWGIGDGMTEEEIILVLSFLASRSLVEWKVEMEAGEVTYWEQVGCLQWRLVDGFYEFAIRIIEKKLESEAELLEAARITDESSKKTQGNRQSRQSGTAKLIDTIFKVLKVAICTQGDFNTPPDSNHVNEREALRNAGTGVHSHAKSLAENICMDAATSKDGGEVEEKVPVDDSFEMEVNCQCRPAWKQNTGKDRRLFMPGSLDSCPFHLIREDNTNSITKLSMVSSKIVEIPSFVSFSSLKVALLSSNHGLKCISAAALNCMAHLVLLDLKKCTVLRWLPRSISNLHSLELLDLSSCTHLLSLPPSIGKLGNLRFLRLSGCTSLSHLPKSLGQLSRLEILDLSMCVRLSMLPASVGRLRSLQILKLYGCYSLHSLPLSMSSLKKLTLLELSGCSNLTYKLPYVEQIKLLIGLQEVATMAVPTNLWKLGQVEVLFLCSLKNLTYLPRLVGKLQHLRHLSLSSCRSLEFLPDDIGSLFLLLKLDLSHTAVRKLPDTLGQLRSLTTLCLRGCSRLLCIPSSIGSLSKLEILDMAECWDLVVIPESMGEPNALPELLKLDMAGCSIKQLPYFFPGALPKLQKLNLSGCQNLTSLPQSFGALTCLQNIDFEGCKALSSLHNAGFVYLQKLSWLSLRNCTALNTLPVSEFAALKSLKFLDVSGCSGLCPFPEALLSAAREQRFTLVRWGAVWH